METNENNTTENNTKVKLLFEVNEISIQMVNVMEYYHKKLKDITTEIEKYNLSQYMISDIQRIMYITDHNLSTYSEIHRQMEQNLYDICQHDWCDDYIDGLNYECRRIIYCKKCQLTKQS